MSNETTTKAEEFYSNNIEKMEVALNAKDELDDIKANLDKDDASLELLVDLAKQGDLDPWDIDLEMVTSKYLQAIGSNEQTDSLKEAGRAIFYASVLLRMKSDILVEQSNDALKIGVHNELDDGYLLEEELADKPTTQVTFNDLESAIRRKYIQKAKRFRRLTLKDLISALSDAKEEEEARIMRRQQKLFDLSDYSIIAPDVEGDILELTHAEDLEHVIERLRIILPEHLYDGASIEFKELVQMVGNWSNAFLATLFLAHEKEISYKQEEFYGDLYLYEPEQ